MKKWLAGFCFLMLVHQAQAQDTILVAGVAPHLYMYHGVLPGETYYSIGRNFSVSPHAIAELNKTDLQKGLKAYQLIKIPLIPANFAQQSHPRGTDIQPLYHKVQPHETLYHIGLEHNKVPADLLRSWNHLSGNSIAAGQYLIVGWLKKGAQHASPAEGIAAADKHTPVPVTSGSEPVAATTGGAAAPAAANKTTVSSMPATAPEPDPQNKVTVPSSTSTAGAPARAAAAEGGGFLAEVIAAERDKRSASGPAAVHSSAARRDAVKMTEKKTPPAKPDENSFSKMLSRVSAENRPAPAPQRSAVPAPAPSLNRKPAATDASPSLTKLPPAAGATKDTAAAESVPAMAANSPFAALYQQQTLNGTAVNVEKGAGGWFKSNVVPGSGRYYALYDKAPRGTVIKVINPVNGQYIFVKVLDAVPKLGENHNLVIKISDAAMQDLGTSASRFWCRLEYRK